MAYCRRLDHAACRSSAGTIDRCSITGAPLAVRERTYLRIGLGCLDRCRNALPRSTGTFDFHRSRVVAYAISCRARCRSKVQIARCARENGIPEYGERINGKSAVFYLVNRTDVDGRLDIISSRCSCRASPCGEGDRTAFEENHRDDDRDDVPTVDGDVEFEVYHIDQ